MKGVYVITTTKITKLNMDITMHLSQKMIKKRINLKQLNLMKQS